MRFITDKYILASLALILIIASVCIFIDDNDEDITTVGIISNVKETENGNTFILTDSKGISIRCFFNMSVKDGMICSVTGSFSKDGTMFFVSGLTIR